MTICYRNVRSPRAGRQRHSGLDTLSSCRGACSVAASTPNHVDGLPKHLEVDERSKHRTTEEQSQTNHHRANPSAHLSALGRPRDSRSPGLQRREVKHNFAVPKRKVKRDICYSSFKTTLLVVPSFSLHNPQSVSRHSANMNAPDRYVTFFRPVSIKPSTFPCQRRWPHHRKASSISTCPRSG